MEMGRLAGRSAALLLAAGLALASTPGLADVKDGVDAWSAGDYAAAVREWTGPAQAGDTDAQFNLAQAYRLGRGVDEDMAQAEALYALAAAQGHIRAGDQYGLILFQKGEREAALPYIRAAAGRGDPRSQYLLGIAHFNGDLVEKDWTRAYALLTLANAAGLPQARGAINQMDEYIPLAERQEAQTLAAVLKRESEASRARELAAVDLALGDDAPSGAVARSSVAPGANYTLAPGAGAQVSTPARPVTVAAAPPPRAEPAPVPAAAPARTSAPGRAASGGDWAVQLGAFGVAGNADRMWDKVAGRPELAGATKRKVEGRLTRLLAAGFASQAEANRACSRLKAAGFDCLVTR